MTTPDAALRETLTNARSFVRLFDDEPAKVCLAEIDRLLAALPGAATGKDDTVTVARIKALCDAQPYLNSVLSIAQVYRALGVDPYGQDTSPASEKQETT